MVLLALYIYGLIFLLIKFIIYLVKGVSSLLDKFHHFPPDKIPHFPPDKLSLPIPISSPLTTDKVYSSIHHPDKVPHHLSLIRYIPPSPPDKGGKGGLNTLIILNSALLLYLNIFLLLYLNIFYKNSLTVQYSRTNNIFNI